MPTILVNKSSADHPGYGRIMNPDWVDLGLLKKWKDKCLSFHGNRCHNPLKIWSVRPVWLIDVAQKCLVPGNVDGDYVALSYTYGGNKQHFINIETLAKLQKPGALDISELSKYVAPIIRRAMYLTSFVGERYLWVDAICIFHHDHASTAEQLRSMGAIYANAILTIVAGDGDSESGLPGLRGVSDSRKLKQTIIPFSDEKIIKQNTVLVTSLPFISTDPHSYHQRGWIYQEYRMAQRRIIFKEKELHWEYSDAKQHFRAITAGFPDYSSLQLKVSQYNNTCLRYDEDALPAISGMLSVFSRSFPGGFLFGIPEMFFEHGLSWQPCFSHTNMRRRTPSGRSLEEQLAPPDLPSWSWIGWKGSISDNYAEPFPARSLFNQEGFVVDSRFQETIPITEWYTGSSPDEPLSKRRMIRSTWYENRDKYKDLTEPLPAGWTRHDAPADENIMYPDGCGKFIFKHERDSNEWYYPFPVADIQESTPPITPIQTPYLFCETHKAELFGCLAGDCNDVKLHNASRQEVGTLRLPNKDYQELFPEFPTDEIGHPIDLVAVSKVRIYSQTYDESKRGYIRPWKKEFKYVVLWVEWKDGIAYRVASGEGYHPAQFDALLRPALPSLLTTHERIEYSNITAADTCPNQAIAVPSRVYFTPSHEKPLNGLRVGIKENIDIAGATTFASYLAYGKFPGIKSQHIPAGQRFSSWRKCMSEFTDAEVPTGDSVYFMLPGTFEVPLSCHLTFSRSNHADIGEMVEVYDSRQLASRSTASDPLSVEETIVIHRLKSKLQERQVFIKGIFGGSTIMTTPFKLVEPDCRDEYRAE
ncbi:heterokaryon incompatibility protein [Fusarium pseudocircinatum]|uniref:Heterokaryon incompatibility protein n=1 Tax=Fusarium pseudocircinatum TaxID=56676 RepID=A0A8H5NUI6_9HYPO|nr:heterokaryon incompatibility protein [Fusarium pseudocircinatum]